MGLLAFASVAADRERTGEGFRHHVGVEQNLAFHVTGRAAGGLNEARLAAQEAFLIGVEDAHECHFRKVEAFAEEIDADEDVERAGAQATKNLDAFDRIDVGVQVLDLQAAIPHEVGEVLGHPLGQRRDERTETAGGDGLGFADDILDLAGDRADFHDRVEQARRTDDLFGDDGRDFVFVGRRGSGDVDCLVDDYVEFFWAQWPVFQRGG